MKLFVYTKYDSIVTAVNSRVIHIHLPVHLARMKEYAKYLQFQFLLTKSCKMLHLIHHEHYIFATFHFFIALLPPVYSWKLQLCLNGTTYKTSSDNCKYGIWFTEPVVVHKICFEHGVWAIYKEFCEDDPIIWSVLPSTSGCIRHEDLGKRIIGVLPLGQDEHSGAIASTSNRRLFFNNHKLKHGMRVSFINAPAYLEVLTWGPPQLKFSLHQHINNDLGILQQCLIKGEHSFFGYYRVRLESHQNTSFFLSRDACFTSMVTQTGEGGRRVQLLPSEIDFDILQNTAQHKDDDSMQCEQYVTIDDLFEKGLDDITDLLAKEPDGKLLSRSSVNIVEKLVDRETHKIVMKLLSVHFRNESFGKQFETWQFLNVVKQIFSMACPESMVPNFFTKQIYLLFQILLHESFLHFPNHIDTDARITRRIRNALQVCLRNATALKFKTGKNCTEDAPLLTKLLADGTQNDILVEMPSFIKVNGVNYDLLMECIWKLMNFAHYYCADNFQEFAAEHSVLEGHWYKLFSPSIIRRWKYPGRGYQAFQKIFMSIDLEKSVRNLDFCVSAARLHSSYKGWLKRPLSHGDKDKQMDIALHTDSSGNTDDSLQLMWNGQAHCMRDYMDPALKFPYDNSIEKCGIRSPHIPLRL